MVTLIKISKSAFLFFFLLVFVSQASAAINVTSNGVAIGGYDPVAYFTENRSIKGDPKLRLKTKDDVYWLFSNEENRKRFIASPEKYIPQYGGFCAFAMGYRVKAKADPTIFTIVDGKLYMNQSQLVKQRWLRKQATLIELGDRYWPRFR